MATGKRFYWLKLKESFMTSDTVDYFMSQPNGANYVVLYQMLCLKTINTDGRLERIIGEMIIPFDVEKIQRDCKWFSEDTIRVALTLYKSFGLVYEDANGTLVMTNHNELVGSETDYASQKRLQRVNNIPQILGVDNSVDNVHIENRDKIIDIDIKKEIHIEKEKAIIPYQTILEKYHSMCPSLPKVAKLTQQRKDAIKARFNEYNGQQTFEEVFKKVETSDFLTGRMEGRDFKASFDWIIKPSNFIKILEGNYDNRKSTKEDKDVGFDLDDFFNSATKRRINND